MDNAELRLTTRDLYGYLLRRFIKPTRPSRSRRSMT
jgi:hypothetical protein